jgi:hypothetical protein
MIWPARSQRGENGESVVRWGSGALGNGLWLEFVDHLVCDVTRKEYLAGLMDW